ncbi:photosynthetic complex putative assembly protein PuhB [Acuticoccus kandeliae]|uniref:photosynthetic complex putative assembly protein PuhB n=1 Tax=Acuticoccus kandeliae TaxID=2073160 RepID=UPI000D3E92F7|nr:photosynthetic complex putative assembly protein PuhB [Acuticoccus kandeliae]
MSEDIHVEPLRGLPEPLPEGERILWQGAPDWKALMVDVFHARAVLIYAAILIVWRTASILHDGGSAEAAAIAGLWLLLLPIGAIAILGALAWATAASTVYTITNRRIVMRIGIALTVTLNLPFRSVAAAHYKAAVFGTGDIAVALSGSDRISFLVLWPHARPWAVKRPQPMMRGVPDGERVANILAKALAANARQAALTVEPAPARAAAAIRPAALTS